DHIGSLYAVLDAFEIGAVIMPNLSADSIPKDDYYKKFINSVKTNAEKEIYTNGGKKYAFGEINIDVFSPLKTYEDMNSCSIAARISYYNTSVMVTGDIQSDAEADIIKNFGNIKSDILCVSHHGSKTTTSESWLDAVNPHYAVVSCGVNNDYGHPHIDLLKRLESHKINYYRTDLSGDILFRCDGKNVVYLGDNYYGMDRTK
ncbi:MAG: MBL fold metallo-hydrolase, partial [Ruminococcus sp.]|nr:MBL fold metallo-hydrolase [Candidatus Copronaster equi]